MPSIRKHKDKWRAEVFVHGKRKSAVWDTKREALQWAQKVEGELRYLQAHKTFDDLADEYQRRVTAQKAGERFENLRIETFRQHFSGELTRIDAPDIARWRDARLADVSASTVVREANILRNMFAVARKEWRWIAHDPFQGVKLPKESAPRRARWTWQQIKRVMRAAQQSGQKTQEVGEAFRIALHTGMRLQEVLAAPDGLDATRQVVTVKTKTHPLGDEIPVSKRAVRLLQRPPFQVNANEASTLFRMLTKRLLIDGLRFHDARASALTWLAKRVDVLTLARVSRHKDLKILMSTYYRATSDEVAQKLR